MTRLATLEAMTVPTGATVVDLSHPIFEDMPVYPGTAAPEIVTECTVADDGFVERKITFFSHTGTHVDAPAHLIENGRTLDGYPVGRFCGSAVVVDVAGAVGRTIEAADLDVRLKGIEGIDFVLLRTGWSRYWRSDRYFSGYPVLGIDAATRLAGLGLKGVGFDTISPDAIESTDLPVHRALLGADLIIIENLTGLELLPAGEFHFSCLPLAIVDADGSPVRAIALID